MLKKLFGGQKKEDFFLDLSDGQGTPTPATTTPSTPTPSTPTPIAEPEPVATTPAAPEAIVEAPAPAAVVSAAPEAAPETSEPASVNFATTYLQPSGAGAPRRRPRANMSGFMDMARKVRG